MSHPLLTKVLADALNSPGVFEDPLDDDTGLATDVIAAIPPDLADRLERALARCAFPGCGESEDSIFHEHLDCEPLDHEPTDICHPYQPLVTP